jgi:hypothetical protein
MCVQYARWLAAPFFALICLQACGALSIEPTAPEEPVVSPEPAPRLMRRDGGNSVNESAEGGP